MDENIKKANRIILENVKKALLRNRFECEIFEEKIALVNYVVEKIGEGKNIGIGGSMSVVELDIIRKISDKNKIFTHTSQMSLDERRKVWLSAIDSDFYLASPQAITMDGRLIFVDGTGNRCAAITWGPKNILLFAGINKIVKNEDEGLWRSRNIAAIRNNIRLSKKNPCVVSGRCEDCYSEERICNILTVLWKRPKITNIMVLLLNEEIGY